MVSAAWVLRVTATVLANLGGLILNAAGVILLFYFGMPYRTRMEGKTAQTVILPGHDDMLKRERLYDRLAVAGLFFILVGTALQVYANLVA
jgi:hypothetical protein